MLPFARSRRTLLALLPVAAFVGIGWGVLSRPSRGPNPVPESSFAEAGVAPREGSLAPEFALSTADGDEVHLGDFRGQVVLLNFWATWCAPCRLEMPAIELRYQSHRHHGFAVLAVNDNEPLDNVLAFQNEMGITFPLLLDPGEHVHALYAIRGWPTSFFVNREGVIEVQHIGVMTERQLDGYLAELGLEP